MSRKKKANKINTKKRLAILLAVISLLLIVCIVRAWSIVRKNGDEYYHKALAQATGASTVLPAKPGIITDTNGTVLASVKKVYRLILDPKVLYETEKTNRGSLEKTIEILSESFSLDAEELRKAYSENSTLAYVRFGGETILSEEEMEVYEENKAAFEAEKKAWNSENEDDPIKAKVAGVWFEEEYRREYPLHDLLSKVIGYTSEDTTEGILGLELSYDSYLRGSAGKEYSYIDEDGNVSYEVAAATDGYNLETSLDVNVAEAVRDQIERFMEETGAKRVNVLVMDPNNGEILAMESDTEFDLNDPTDITALFTEEEYENPSETFLLQEAYKGRLDTLEAMTKEEQQLALLQQVQINYAVSGTYEPGSTGKAITLSAGIESGVIDPDETNYCDGSIQVDKYTIHCHSDTICGDLTPMEALGRSCNVCFVKMGLKIGSSIFSRYQKIYNLGQKTGIDLPGETSAANLIYSEENMHEIELSTGSFGQGYNVTMIQFASAYASIVNGGYYYKPHVVRRVTDNEGNIIMENEAVLVRRTISEETSAYMREALRYVTTKGTGTIAPTEGYIMGGKTGAAEKLPRGTGKYVVSFIGAAPIDDPVFLLYVVVEEPDVEDQSMSAPAQQLAHYCFESLYSYFKIYPDSDEDAYSYDWSQLRDFQGESDSDNGESFIDDPEGEIDWLSDDIPG